jgi:hypothetical protein
LKLKEGFVQTNCLFFYNFRSVALRKITALFVVSFLLFNLIFSPHAEPVNLNIETKIQKDAFSAVLFVSETIGKVSMSISNMLALKSDFSKVPQKSESDNPEPVTGKDALFLSQMLQNKKADNGSFYISKISSGIFYSAFSAEPYMRKRKHRDIVSDFLEQLLCYISSKNTCDNIASVNNINLFTKPS